MGAGVQSSEPFALFLSERSRGQGGGGGRGGGEGERTWFSEYQSSFALAARFSSVRAALSCDSSSSSRFT